MADNNNAQVADMPTAPHPALRKLDRLVGTWEVAADGIDGRVRFDWMEGGFFLVQDIDLNHGRRHIKGVEYIGYDADTETLRSHVIDNHGSNFAYTWDIEDDVLMICFGEKYSDSFYRGQFTADGHSNAGAWQWPDGDGGTGGYASTMTRLED